MCVRACVCEERVAEVPPWIRSEAWIGGRHGAGVLVMAATRAGRDDAWFSSVSLEHVTCSVFGRIQCLFVPYFCRRIWMTVEPGHCD